METNKIKVAIVEDAVEWATTLQELLAAEPDLHVVGLFDTIRSAAKALPDLHPNVVLLDLQLPDGDGSDLIPQIAPALPECQFVVLTAAESDEAIRNAITKGAEGYVLKRAGFSRIVRAIRDVQNGDSPFCRWAIRRLLSFIRDASHPHRILAKLTPRENELLALVCGDGLSIKEAAFQLKLTHASARTYLQRIYRKLGLSTRWELDRTYFSLGQPAATSRTASLPAPKSHSNPP